MVKFAVCDDDREMAAYISEKLHEYYPDKCEIKRYFDGESLLDDIYREHFDVIFLDVGLPGLNGMQIAEKIREDNRHVKIVFVTNNKDLAHMGYVYGAFRYVRKMRLEEELREAAESLKKYFDTINDYVNFKTPTGEIIVDVKRIEYFEVKGHSLTMVCGENEEQICGTMSGYADSLKSKGFTRIHKSYLVNIRYIHSLDKNDVILTNGKKLPLSRKRADNVKKERLDFSRTLDSDREDACKVHRTENPRRSSYMDAEKSSNIL